MLCVKLCTAFMTRSPFRRTKTNCSTPSVKTGTNELCEFYGGKKKNGILFQRRFFTFIVA
jgi:hypothetical protein